MLQFIKKEVILIQFFAPYNQYNRLSIIGFIFSTVETKTDRSRKLSKEKDAGLSFGVTALWFRPMGKCLNFAENVNLDGSLCLTSTLGWCRQFLSCCGPWFLTLTISTLSFTASNSIPAVLKKQKKKQTKATNHMSNQ